MKVIINGEQVDCPTWVQWVAIDTSGEAFGFSRKPTFINGREWVLHEPSKPGGKVQSLLRVEAISSETAKTSLMKIDDCVQFEPTDLVYCPFLNSCVFTVEEVRKRLPNFSIHPEIQRVWLATEENRQKLSEFYNAEFEKLSKAQHKIFNGVKYLAVLKDEKPVVVSALEYNGEPLFNLETGQVE